MGDIPKNANTQADPRMTDLLDVSPDTFDILWYIVWEQYMTAKSRAGMGNIRTRLAA